MIMSEHFLEINEKFYKDYDNWDKAKSNFAFNLGKPTTAFNSNFNVSLCDYPTGFNTKNLLEVKKIEPILVVN